MVGTRFGTFINSVILGRTLGGVGLSVISLVAPVPLVYFSIGSLIGVGGSIVSSIALGKGEKEQCAQVYTLTYIVSLGIGIVLTVGGLLMLDTIVSILGTNEENFSYTRDYIRFYILGGTGVLLLYIPLNYLRITGKPHLAMTMLLVMSSLNIIGLGIFVIFLDMGPGGAALASVTSSCLTFVFGISRLGGKSSNLKLQKPSRIPYIFAVATAGSPSALNNICRAVQQLSINLLFVRMGFGMYLPCYTLVGTIGDFMLAIILGISQTALPLVGISFGEKDFRSIRIIIKKTLVLGNSIIGLCAVFIILVHTKIGLFFGLKDSAILWNAGIGFIFLAASSNFAFINNVLTNYFSATRRIVIANIIVVSRLVVFIVLPAYLLFSSLDIYAVWISLIITEVVTFLIVLLLIALLHKKNPHLSRYLLLDSALVENSRVIDFSVKNTTEDVDIASTQISGFCEENEILPKQTMYIRLAIEEMLMMINEYSLKKNRPQYTDIRIMIIHNSIIVMRIRNSGKYFNPVEFYHENKNTEEGLDKTMGIGMILKMAKQVEYRETFGMNNLIVTI
jgi:Na+-driven multidrug efflux pump/anti-sigma regulatory factor (Ser/Thr protein kinase)